MDSQTFDLIMARFDSLDDKVKETNDLLAVHIVSQTELRSTVERHSTYFSLLMLGIPSLGAAIAAKLGWKG